MKTSLMLTIAVAFAAAALGTTATAENTIDKGENGIYVREGRFVKPVLSASPRIAATESSSLVQSAQSTLVDKGDLGTYQRNGRMLRVVRQSVSPNHTAIEAVTPAGGVKHEHGLNGKEHRNSSY